jgi:hypothetical protein
MGEWKERKVMTHARPQTRNDRRQNDNGKPDRKERIKMMMERRERD